MKLLAAEPNHVGSPHDKANAEWILKQFKSLGLGRAYRDLRGALSHADQRNAGAAERPASRSRRRCRSRRFPATLSATAKDRRCPPMSPIQGDGDVTAPLVYVNYGMPDDYKRSSAGHLGQGQDRHRPLRRGLARPEAQAGAGSRRGRLHYLFRSRATTAIRSTTSIRKGPTRPPHGFQRGSVADMPIYPGDPLTPGVGATKDAKRLTARDAPTILKIPGAADLLCRRAGVAGGAGRRGGAGQLARRTADHLSRRPAAARQCIWRSSRTGA